MNKENTKYLFEKYPKIFAGKDKLNTENLMEFGFACGDGWLSILDCLCNIIQNYCETAKYEDIKDLYYYWVKFYNKIIRIVLMKIFNKFLSFKTPLKKEYYSPQVLVIQVKEKFGGLRFYIRGGDEFIHNIIHMAEEISFYVCEECGSTKNITTEGKWTLTLCKKCRKKLFK